MNAARLNELLVNPRTLSGEDLGALENLCRDFPAFGLPYILLAKAYHDRNDYRYRETLHAAALRCPNRLWLKDFIEERLQVQTQASTVHASGEAAEPIDALLTAPGTESNLPADVQEEEAVALFQPETGTALPIPEVQALEANPVNTPQPSNEQPAAPAVTEPTTHTEPVVEITTKAIQPETDTNSKGRSENPLTDTTAKPWRKKHVDPAAMTIYSIEDHFPPSEEQAADQGARDFFSWLRNPHKGLEPPPVKPETREEKDDLIQRFLESRPSVSRPKKEFFNPVNMAKKSEQQDPELVTETLANIYWKQGNHDKAIAMFEKLILKYPGKRPYFAALIQKIRQENES